MPTTRVARASNVVLSTLSFLFFLICEIEGRHANAKEEEADNHMPRFLSSREEISQRGIEPPTSSLRFGYLSTVVQ